MEKYCRAGQTTVDSMAHAHCIFKEGYKHTLRICDTKYYTFRGNNILCRNIYIYTKNFIIYIYIYIYIYIFMDKF